MEVEAVTADYFSMLRKELAGGTYNKSEHRRALLKIVSGRSEGSIERKHQNISAILIEARFPYIRGYKPLSNYQALLSDVVLEYLEDDAALAELALRYVEASADSITVPDLLARMTAPPLDLLQLARAALNDHARARRARKADYLAIEAANRRLGLAGERFVIAYEHERLSHSGFPHLAQRIEHVSTTKGDGLGFDVLSFTRDGREKFIEVKTTRMGAVTPFYLTSNELTFSDDHDNQFSLYRVFAFDTDPHVFALDGALRSTCELRPSQYLASPRSGSLTEE